MLQIVVFLLCAAISMLQVQCINSIPVFQISNKYIQTGTYVLNTINTYGNASMSSVTIKSYSATLNRIHTSYRYHFSLQQVNYQIKSSLIVNISIDRCTPYTNSITICLYSTLINQLQAMKVRYIVLDRTFNKIELWTLYCYSNSATTLNNVTPYLSNYNMPVMNQTGTLRNFLFIIGFNVTAPDNNNQFDIKASATYLSSTTLQLKIQTSLTKNIGVSGMIFALITINQAEIASWPFPSARLNYVPFTGAASSPALFTDSSNITRDYNTFWGLTGININNQGFFSFTSSINAGISVTGNSANPFNNLNFILSIFEFKQCVNATPYYMISQDLCYDICLPRYYQSNTQMLCLNCISYDCYKCISNGSCTICNSTGDFRTLNVSTTRCDPIDGYFDDNTNNSIAQPCNSNCKTCLGTAVLCTSCFNGTYLNSFTCLPCSINCQICNSNSSCSTCDSNYSPDGSGGCVSNINCTLITNCTTCVVTTGCSLCDIGFQLNSSTLCLTLCGDGLFVASSQQCDDQNLVNGDGCSSTCIKELDYFCINTNLNKSNCYPCINNCEKCTTNTSCLYCKSNYLLNATSQTCDLNCVNISFCSSCHLLGNASICDSCSAGYLVVNSTCFPKCGDGILIAPQVCDDNNTVSGDGCSPICIVESSFYCQNSTSLNKSICYPCLSHCQICISNTTCTNCTIGYLWNSTITSCYSDCSSINQCSNCHIIGNTTLCDNCSSGYTINNGSCSPICGDGVIILPQVCDDGNTANNDGCSATCTFENDYICIIVGTASNCSICPVRTIPNSIHGTCVPCTDYACLKCNSLGGCISCSLLDHRVLEVNSSTCEPSLGFYDDGSNSLTLPCHTECRTCSGPTNSDCLSCSSIRLLTSSTCPTCQSLAGAGCSSCSRSGLTVLCSAYFVNSSGNDNSGSNTNLLLVILLPILACLLCCCLILFVIWRRRKNKVEEEEEEEKEKRNKEQMIDDKLKESEVKNNLPKLQSVKLGNKINLDKPTDTEENELSMEEFKHSKKIQRQTIRDDYDQSEVSDVSQSYEDCPDRGR